MFYKNLKLIAFLAFLLQINQTSAQFVPCERSYTVFFNPLLQKIDDFSDFNGNIILSRSSNILPLSGTSFAANGQELIKHNGKIYIFFSPNWLYFSDAGAHWG